MSFHLPETILKEKLRMDKRAIAAHVVTKNKKMLITEKYATLLTWSRVRG
jgi:hypothetical protein